MLVTDTDFLNVLVWVFIKVDKEIASSRVANASQDVDQCGFTGAVSTKKSEDLSFLDGDVDFVEGVKLALLNFISFDKIGDFDHDVLGFGVDSIDWTLVLWDLVVEVEILGKNMRVVRWSGKAVFYSFEAIEKHLLPLMWELHNGVHN